MRKYKTVQEFIEDLDKEKRAQVEQLRQIIFASEPGLAEHIKWNAPSYMHNDEDRITFNLMNKEGVVKLVLHMGALRKENKKGAPIFSDDTGLIAWSSDIRGVISFQDIDSINSNQEQLKGLLVRWLAIVN